MLRSLAILALLLCPVAVAAHETDGGTSTSVPALGAGHLDDQTVVAFPGIRRHGSTTFLEGRVDVASGMDDGPRMQRFRLDLESVDLGGGLTLSLVEMVGRRSDPLGARALGVSPMALRLRRPLLVGHGLRLVGHASAAFSILQATRVELPPLLSVASDLVLCGTQSHASVGLVLELGPVALEGFATWQGDPFHLSGGRTCLGDPPAWLEGRLVGVAVRVDIARDLVLEARLAAEDARVSYDLEDAAGSSLAYGTVETHDVTATANLGIQLR